jgi:hypothetical protein
MKQDWLKDCKTEEDRAKRKAQLSSYKQAYRELVKVLDGLELSEAVTDYNNGWQHKQAHRNGELTMLKRIKGLLDLKD